MSENPAELGLIWLAWVKASAIVGHSIEQPQCGLVSALPREELGHEAAHNIHIDLEVGCIAQHVKDVLKL